MNETKILGPNGYPAQLQESEVEGRLTAKSWSSFVSALSGLDSPHSSRARQPFKNHAWVYTATMAIATNIAQVPMVVYREVPDDPSTQRKVTKDARKPKRGIHRRAVERHLDRPERKQGLELTSLEPDFDHPIYDLVRRPNPHQTRTQFIEFILTWLTLRGAGPVVKTGISGTRLNSPSERPSELWPISPDSLCPEFEGTNFVGWRVTTSINANSSIPGVRRSAFFAPWEVMVLKYTNPDDILGWQSPLTAAASGIDTDLAAITYNRSVLLNGAKPGGILLHDDDIDEEEEAKLQQYWKQKHQGPENANRLAVLTGNFKYVDIGLGPRDMQYLEQRKWDREEILGALMVPPSVVSLASQQSFANMLSQDKNFWDKKLLPIVRAIEDLFDTELLFTESDDIILAFDLSKVEALRAGLEDKVNIAVQMSGPTLHVPPRLAFKVAGLQMPRYEGDDTSFVTPNSAPAEDVADGFSDFLSPGGSDETDPADSDKPGPDQPAEPGEDQPPKPSTESKVKAVNPFLEIWTQWLAEIHGPNEVNFSRRFRSWVRAEKRKALEAFDAAEPQGRSLVSKQDFTEIEAVLPSLDEMINRIKEAHRGLRTGMLEDAFSFEEKLRGTPLEVQIDNDLVQDFMERKEQVFSQNVPATLRKNLANSVRAGVQAGETVPQIRQRVAEVFDRSASPVKVRTVARSEVTSFLNGSKMAMMEASGIDRFDWVTAGDERVREDHVAMGALEPQPSGTNWLSLIGAAGRLEFPGDSQGPPDQVINCRCTIVAV